MIRKFKSFLQDKSGVTALEYGMIAAVIIVALVSTLSKVGNSLGNTFNTISTNL
jgi:pilus assembly protein Flp/PilA